jgi:hypothetical protein
MIIASVIKPLDDSDSKTTKWQRFLGVKGPGFLRLIQFDAIDFIAEATLPSFVGFGLRIN